MITNAFKENDDIAKLTAEKELLVNEERKLNMEKERQQLANRSMMISIMMITLICTAAPLILCRCYIMPTLVML